MAHTLYSDIIFDPELFMEYLMEMNVNPTALVTSGILRPDAQLSSMLSGGGNVVSVPSFKPLTGDSQLYNGTDITVNSISSVEQTAMVIARANAWGSQDLASELASKDPMRAIAESVVKYWQEERQKILIKVMTGVFNAGNMTNHVTDVAIEDGNNALDVNLISEDVVIEAVQKALGDNGSKVTTISMHSKVYSRLQKLNLIDFTPLSNQTTLVPRFLGKTVIVDDTHPVVAGGTSGYKYSTYMYGANSIAIAEAPVKVATEIEREALVGGGREHLVNRTRFVYHPYGMKFTQNSVASNTPTNAELILATNWTRVYEDKNVPLVEIVTNG